MHVIVLCTADGDRHVIRKLISQTQLDHEPNRCTVVRLPHRPAAAAAVTGQLIGTLTPESAQKMPGFGAHSVMVAVLSRTPQSAGISRISHAHCGGDTWFADLIRPGDIQIGVLSDSPAAWSFAAACSLLPPESVCGFSASPDNQEVFSHLIDAIQTSASVLISADRRFSPHYIEETRAAAARVADTASFTASQRTLLIRAATEAAVRIGTVPDLLEMAGGTTATLSDRNSTARKLIERLQELDNEKT